MSLTHTGHGGRVARWAVCIFAVFLTAVVAGGCDSQDEGTTTTVAPATTATTADQTATTAAGDTTTTAGEGAVSIPAPFDTGQPIRVALIKELLVGAQSQEYVQAAQEVADGLGIELLVSDAGGDAAKQVTLLDAAINNKVDGIILGHGKTEALMPGVEKALAAGIPVVTDNLIMPVPGVPEVEQDDLMMAYEILKKLVADTDGIADIAYIWVAGFAPMEKRERIWQDVLWRYQGINEIARYGTASASTMAETLTQTEAVLQQYPEGELTAIYATWNEFAKGAAQAVQQSGRDEVKVYGIDLTDVDIELMKAPGSAWVATASASAFESGRVGIRAIAKLIAGEKVDKYLQLKPVLVTQDFLRENNINATTELGQYIPGYEDSGLAWSPWMEGLLAKNGVSQ